MRTPRVAFVTNLCPYYRRPLFELLARRLHVTFYFFSDGGERYLGRGVGHEDGDFAARRVRRISVAGNPVLTGLVPELKRSRYDVVVKCLNGRLMVPFVVALAQARQLPLVLWTGMWHHPRTLAHRATKPVVECVYRRSEAIVTYGEHVKKFVETVPGVDPAKVFVAGQAIDAQAFSHVIPRFEEPPEILFVGQLEAHKGVSELLDAFAKLDVPGARLKLAGTGALEPQVRERAVADPRIELLGHLPRHALKRQFETARCLVLPSVTTTRYREAWGLVVNEAMTAGIPVIATDAVGAAAGGLVKHERNGLVVPERVPHALAAALARLAHDAQFARGLGEQARVDVSEHTYERMARAFEHAIAHAITRGAWSQEKASA